MKKYRVVEFSGGGYGIQCKRHWWSFWKLLAFGPVSFSNGALMEIANLKARDQELINQRKRLKIKSIYRYD